jgi:uncharacterized membrane protein
VLAERSIAESWLAEQPFYFPGLGMLGVVVLTYAVGLLFTTLVGRFVWRMVDGVLEALPGLGMLYRTLKQVLGYGEGENALFERVVLVPARAGEGEELGLVTKTLAAAAGEPPRLVVFVPVAPTPTSGRMIVVEADRVRPSTLSVHEALKLLVALGKLDDVEVTEAPTGRP